MSVLDAIRAAVGQDTADALPLPSQDWLRKCADMDDARLERYERAETYAAGEQPTKLTARQKVYLEASGLPYVENICKPVLHSHTNRLKVSGFQVDGNDAATKWLNETWWAGNRMGVRQRPVHRGAALRGDAFVLAEPEFDEDGGGRVVLRRQRAARIKPVYGDDEDELELVVKVWDTSKKHPQLNPTGVAIRRMNLFYPDRVEKYFAATAGDNAEWSPWFDDDDREPVYQVDDETGEPLTDAAGDPLQAYDPQGAPVFDVQWPMPWTMDGDPDGEPIGLSFGHFREDPGDETFGTSVLRPVIPLQDLLTKQAGDLANVCDHAFPVNTMAGNLGEGSTLTLNPGEWVKGPENATFGQLEGADPLPMMQAIEGTMRRVSVVSATPIHSLVPSGQLPSGESLKTAEGPLTRANEDRIAGHSTPWEDLARASVRIAQAFGFDAPPLEPEQTVTVLWEPVETRNDESEVTVAEAKQRLGVSQHTLIRELGYDPDEEAKLRKAEQKASLDAAKDAFNRGRLPGDEPPEDEDIDDRADGQK